MELKSKKYKTRIIIIGVILIISTILGTISEKQCKKYYDETNKIIEIIQSIPEEEYSEKIKERNIDTNQEAYSTKEKALETMENVRSFYERLFKYSEFHAVLIFAVAFSGTIIGFMMFFIFTGWILCKILPGMVKWLSILMRILILIIVFPIAFYVLGFIGVIGQLPFIIYTLYKYIKTKKAEDKDDVIIEK